MFGRVNQSGGNIFANASSSMSRTRTNYGSMNEAGYRALSSKDTKSSIQAAKDEITYEFSDNFEEQMQDWKEEDFK
jgi:hypothetical protein